MMIRMYDISSVIEWKLSGICHELAHKRRKKIMIHLTMAATLIIAVLWWSVDSAGCMCGVIILIRRRQNHCCKCFLKSSSFTYSSNCCCQQFLYFSHSYHTHLTQNVQSELRKSSHVMPTILHLKLMTTTRQTHQEKETSKCQTKHKWSS